MARWARDPNPPKISMGGFQTNWKVVLVLILHDLDILDILHLLDAWRCLVRKALRDSEAYLDSTYRCTRLYKVKDSTYSAKRIQPCE